MKSSFWSYCPYVWASDSIGSLGIGWLGGGPAGGATAADVRRREVTVELVVLKRLWRTDDGPASVICPLMFVAQSPFR